MPLLQNILNSNDKNNYTKGNELVIHRVTRINFKYMMLRDRNQTQKRLLLPDSIYVVFWKRQNHRDRRQVGGC